MGDKYTPRGGIPTKFILTRSKLTVLIPLSLLLVFIIWNSSPLGTVSSSAPHRSIVAEEADLFGAYTLQHKDNLNIQDGRNQDPGTHENSNEEIIAAQYDALKDTISAQIGAGEGEHSHGRHEVPNSGTAGEEGTEEHEEVKKDEAELLTLKPKVERDRQNEERFEEKEDAPGNRTSEVNIAMTGIFEEIRSQSLPYSTIITGDADSSCQGRYIYVYDLPPEFNVELAEKCDSLFPSFNLCDYFADSGIGKPVDTRDNGSQIFVPADRWFNTHQYALELVSHARIMKYKCLTEDPNQASLFYIPFYAGLDVIRWNFAQNSSSKKHDELSLKLVRWLEKQPSWTRRGGLDHVMVLGKISWDFRRHLGSDEWGSRLLEFSETQQVTTVLIERNPWAKKDIGVPHPTFFHPRSAEDIDTWLKHIKSQDRTSLVTFVGKERPGTTNVRSELVKQCRNATSQECRFVECNHDLCQVPAFVTKAFLTTHFCMQPVGDSPTRRSVFDSLIAGCIPVLFHPCTAYVQYPWHLPKNESSWSVYISEDEVKAGNANVIETLKKIPAAQRDAMRATIINTIIPGLLYSAPGSDVSPYRDAFVITIDQLLHRVAQLPALNQAAS